MEPQDHVIVHTTPEVESLLKDTIHYREAIRRVTDVNGVAHMYRYARKVKSKVREITPINTTTLPSLEITVDAQGYGLCDIDGVLFRFHVTRGE